MKIGVVGGGVWGSALARLLSNNNVNLFARDSKVVNSINEHHFNPNLKYAVFNDNVVATTDFNLINEMDYVFITLPTQSIRGVLSSIKLKNNKQEIIIASKGIEIDSKLLLSEVIKSVTKSKKISILSGPSFSNEVAQNLPTAVTLASEDRELFEEVILLFKNKNFRLYYSKDILGCQIGGSIKNIYAIAAGISIGLNLGENAKSALISRSFAEILRLANFYDAKNETLFGLSGLGDLILTCNSLKSRNTNFGKLIASHPKTSIVDHLKSQETTEGYFTVQAIYKIKEENKIDMPIASSIYRILFEGSDIRVEINKLLDRPVVDEFY